MPCLAVGVFESRQLSSAAEVLDRAARGALRERLKQGDMDGKTGTTRMLFGLPGVAAERVLLVGLGSESGFGPKEYREAVRAAVAAAADTGATELVLCFGELPVNSGDAAWRARHAALGSTDALYRFDAMKSKKTPPRPLKQVVFAPARKSGEAAAARGTAEGRAIAAGVSLAKDLGNLPGNVCTPAYLAEQAEKLAREWKLGVEVLERREMEKLGMGAVLSVDRGSRQPEKFIELRYRGGEKCGETVGIVDKGIR